MQQTKPREETTEFARHDVRAIVWIVIDDQIRVLLDRGHGDVEGYL
jgi:hypothetical protein